MEEIPGIGVFSSKELVDKTETKNAVKITTYAVLQPHEVSKLTSLGWVYDGDRTFVYNKPVFVEPDPEDFED